ncbi:MAG TPA: glycoside hydrolase family 57 protein [Phycisphaerae bacterium]|nr:glycoside hydrolase family 57 protein [Phycisphaerae bacterium]
MASVCFYFQVHQPFRLRRYSVFDSDANYFDDYKNADICRKVAQKCYLPTNRLLLDLITKHGRAFACSFSITGVALEQFERWAPEVVQSFQALVDTGQVELLAETYYHSLAFLYSREEFRDQVAAHSAKMAEVFGFRPTVFRNTELIYNNDLGHFVQGMGYKGVLAEGADHILGYRSPNFVYRPVGADRISLLLKNYRLSDDIAFRFSDRGWSEWPLKAEKFAQWVNEVNGNGFVVNLFMDYETFGEHQWADSGIFDFLYHMPEHVLKYPDNNFMTLSQAARTYSPLAELDIPHMISWADVERDLSAWLGNAMQSNALHELYRLEEAVKKKGDPALLADWRCLQTSDHFYYMCTKWFADGDVHKYFNPYESPYDSYINFMNVLDNVRSRLRA